MFSTAAPTGKPLPLLSKHRIRHDTVHLYRLGTEGNPTTRWPQTDRFYTLSL